MLNILYLCKRCFVLRLSIVALLLSLTGCASLSPNFQQPQVNLVNISPLPARGLEQRFAIDLRIVNPNSVTLPINGVSFTLSLQGNRVLSGVAGDIPEINGYSDTITTIEASASLLGGLRVLGEFIANPDSPFNYQLDTRIDTSLWLYPITVSESGTITLNQSVKN